MSKTHNKACRVLNYIEHSLIVISTVTGRVSISAFVSLGITSSAIGLKVCAMPVRIKKYEPTNKKKKRKHGKMLLLAKSKLNSTEVLISKALIVSNISHDQFVLMYKMLKRLYDIKKEIKSSNSK